MEPIKKGDLAKCHTPVGESEECERFVLFGKPDSRRMLVKGACALDIRPTKVIKAAQRRDSL